MTTEKKDAVQNGIKRAIFAAVAILLQIAFLYVIYFRLELKFSWISQIISLLGALLILFIYSRHVTSAMKMPWLIIISAFPILGVLLYLMIGLNSGTRRMKERYRMADERNLRYLPENTEVFKRLETQDLGVANQCRYIRDYAKYPVYDNTDVVYYKDSAIGYEALLEALKEAKKFIFMEYFAIEDSSAFKPVHEILKKKAADGVDVRLSYDYVGSMGYIGNAFVDKMERDGIKCMSFNSVNPVINFFLNNRDHRKITVIDGIVGFTGGFNLADEYFHITEPFGHWLDTGVRITGDAVKSMMVTFLENWEVSCGTDDAWEVSDRRFLKGTYESVEKGYVQPYADSPMDDERVGENVYMNILRNAKRYAWFTTPYLVITDEMGSAFSMAAKSGVDVRIITPGIPDKKIIYSLTRSYYADLVRSGVRIFEYSPGFCHAKQCVSDDEVATCGTINLDFRSLYHHFENGVFMYDLEAVHDMKKMFEDTFPKCREVTEEYRTGRSRFLKMKHLILRLFAPLM